MTEQNPKLKDKNYNNCYRCGCKKHCDKKCNNCEKCEHCECPKCLQKI